MNRLSPNKIVLLLVVLLISILFVAMIRNFLMVILLAGIFSAMVKPIYNKFNQRLSGRKNLSSAITLLVIFMILFLPAMGLLSIVAGQAIKIGNSVKPWITQKINEPSAFSHMFESLPYYDSINTYRDDILQKAGELVAKISAILFDNLQAAALSTANFLFLFFIFLYTMFFFLKEGEAILDKILYYLPLTDSDEKRLLDRFTSVTRATLKGTLLIGIIQGSFAGFAFFVVGIDSALFWGTIMTVLSIIPAVGATLVWLPAAIILAASGHYIKAIGLAIFCGVLVGSVDNILRPRFVGKDTKMHELMIFFGTLGGISLFGIIGFIIGPIIAALFVTAWDIYGQAFKEYLPPVIPSRETALSVEPIIQPDPQQTQPGDDIPRPAKPLPKSSTDSDKT